MVKGGQRPAALLLPAPPQGAPSRRFQGGRASHCTRGLHLDCSSSPRTHPSTPPPIPPPIPPLTVQVALLVDDSIAELVHPTVALSPDVHRVLFVRALL